MKIIHRILPIWIILGSLISCSKEDLLFNESQLTIDETLSRPSIPILRDRVIIGNQIWMTKNLSVNKYRNGDLIPQVQDPALWSQLTTGAWCYYLNDFSNGVIYGKLYNWYAVNDSRGLAPAGWHIPTKNEVSSLITYLGGSSVAPNAMKESGTIHWDSPNTATNSSGFTGLPGGYRGDTGAFSNINTYGTWWTSSPTLGNPVYATSYFLPIGSNTGLPNTYIKGGFSVRCIKD